MSSRYPLDCSMPNPIEYLIRLRHLSAAEAFHRVRRFRLSRRLRRKALRGTLCMPAASIDFPSVEALDLPSVLPIGSFTLYGDHDGPSTLHGDPTELAQFEERTRRLYFRDVKPDAHDIDLRQAWEPARLQHVMHWMASALQTTDGELTQRLQKRAKDHLLCWIQSNPFLMGPHYMSPMECGLRLPVFFFALQLLGNLSAQERKAITDAAFQHGWWVFRNLSLYASLGNHTICEAVGLVFGGALFNDTDEGRRWLNRGIELLEQELDHQILDDGGPAEQSLAYHRFVLDLYLLASDFLETNRLHDTGRIQRRLVLAEAFLQAFECSGSSPSIGDSDDGFAVAPGWSPRRLEVSRQKAGITTFRQSGYTVIRTPGNGVFTLDHGPLGLPPLYNHGHADALSMTLTLQGEALLVDPGTYRYNGVDAHRRYFKGTSAHNTVIIDRADQAIWAGGFAWRAPFQTEILNQSPSGENPFEIEAMHDGYRRLSSSVIHKRWVRYTDGRSFRVVDSFEGSGKHEFTLHYHLGPGIEADEIPDGWRLRSGSAKVEILFPGGDRVEKARGRKDPLLGWYSKAYGAIEPCDVLQYRKTGNAKDVSFETIILLPEYS